MSLFRLFLIFVKIGAILLGGGYVILPIMQNEFVEKRNIVSSDVLIDCFALSQSLPGIIAANMSMFIGYKLKGKFGAILAMLGIITVPFLSIILLASILNLLVDNKFVQRALLGVGIAVIALILLTVREMWQKSEKNMFFYFMFILALTALIILKLPPVETIILFLLSGILFKSIQRRFK